MKLLTSPWGIAFIGMLLNLGTTVMMLLPAIGAMQDTYEEIPEKTSMAARMWGFKTEAVDELVKELETERTKLEEEQKGVLAVQSQNAADREELEKVRADIKAMRAEIDDKVVEIQEQELKNLKTLAQTYSAMNPSAVVAIFRELEENMAVKVLSFMKADRVGPILGEMSKGIDTASGESMAKRAARITDKLRLLKPLKKETPS